MGLGQVVPHQPHRHRSRTTTTSCSSRRRASLFGPGGDRGVYKTTDGGATWKQVLKVDDDTGANEVVIDPTSDHKILYASTYQRRRTQCCVNGGGPGSGIWKSTDGGDTWTRLTDGGCRQARSDASASTSIDTARTSSTRRSKPKVLRAAAVAVPRAAAVVVRVAAAVLQAAAAEADAGTAAGGSGVYRTDDGGASWRQVEREQRASDVLQPDPRRSEQPGPRDSRRRADDDLDSTAARRSAERRSDRARRQARDLVGSDQLEPHADRHRRRRVRQRGT